LSAARSVRRRERTPVGGSESPLESSRRTACPEGRRVAWVARPWLLDGAAGADLEATDPRVSGPASLVWTAHDPAATQMVGCHSAEQVPSRKERHAALAGSVVASSDRMTGSAGELPSELRRPKSLRSSARRCPGRGPLQ
jgi:hypothetical protein